MLKRLLFLFMLLFLTACGKTESVIGVVTLDNGTETELKLHYFDSKKEATDYYHKQGVSDYALMSNADQDEKKLFDQIDVEEKDGVKTVKFETNADGMHSDDQAFGFLFEDLGLGTECIYNGRECK